MKGCIGPAFVPELYGEDHELGMFVAIYYEGMSCLMEIFDNDPQVNVNFVDSMDGTPVDFAAIMGELEMMDFLIQRGGVCKLKNKPILRIVAKKRAEAKRNDAK